MKNRRQVLIAALFITLGCAAQAQALPHRTFVATAGDDANDCTFGSPCRTFAGAVTQTAAGGEITALDSGLYGVVTIDKALTLEGAPGAHVALGNGAGTNAVTINAGPSDVIVLRNLHISQVGRIVRGIDFSSGGLLHIESCVVTGFPDAGIRFVGPGACSVNGPPHGCPQLFMKDTISRNNEYGILLESVASLDHCRFENNKTGVYVLSESFVNLRDSVVNGNSQYGLVVSDLSSTTVENCAVTHNVTGIQGMALFGNTSAILVSDTLIAFNATGLSPGGGQIKSFRNNRLIANATNGAFTGAVPQQ